MNIAIIAPSPHRFVMGGAEHLWLGLQRYINEETGHACELVKIPTREDSLPELISAYRLHAAADLRGYDRIVSSKYPAWMACHPRHAIYMLHTLRGLYDCYHFMREPLEPEWTRELAWARHQIALLDHASPEDNGPVMRLLDVLETALDNGQLPMPFARFPGPFSRHLVHALDRFAMQPARIVSYATMSQTVARREGYFPAGVRPRVLHPPPRLEGFRCGGDDYLFTVSRLDAPKRIGLLVEAMRHVSADIPLLIGGTGPDEARLRELAGNDGRIRFLGMLSDAQLLEAYANALAVPFVPYDEDYGLVTIEAMRSGKPVLTVHDAGGVTEFVRHGQTGLCVTPEPQALAAAIDELCNDRARTREMGRAARRSVAGISWKPLAEQVLGTDLPRAPVRARPIANATRNRRRKAVVVITFGVTPPRGGGQSRVFHLYKGLAEHMDITLLCLCEGNDVESRREISPGLVEVRVPKSAEHQHHEMEASRSVNWVPVTDMVASREVHHTPRFLELLDEECADADVVVSSHPYLTSVVRARQPALPLWFEVHNVELNLKRGMLPATSGSAPLLERVEFEERMAWQDAELVFACAQGDLDTMVDLYGPTQAQCIEVPNGFAEEEVLLVPPAERLSLRQLIGLGPEPIVLFLGSWHGPNLEAVERILGYAAALTHARFVVVGSAGRFFQDRPVPDNVRLLGEVDEKVKQVLLGVADLALNPMTSGSGSNLKMLDYFAAGLPVLSTGFGGRGIDAKPGVHFLECDIADFLPSLVRALMEPDRMADLAAAAATMARSRYSWQAIGRNAWEHLARKLD